MAPPCSAEADHGAGEVAEPLPIQAGEKLRRHEIDDVEHHDDRQPAPDFDDSRPRTRGQTGYARCAQREGEGRWQPRSEGDRGDLERRQRVLQQLGQPAVDVLGVDFGELQHAGPSLLPGLALAFEPRGKTRHRDCHA